MKKKNYIPLHEHGARPDGMVLPRQVVLIDNYDSFTWNLVHQFRALGAGVTVLRNDVATVENVAGLQPTHLVVSPGPGNPETAGHSKEIVRAMADRCPILGVCLGHQCIGEVFGGAVRRAGEPTHGRTAEIYHGGSGIYSGIPNPFAGARYHSLEVAENTLPPELVVTAWTREPRRVMGLRHRSLPVHGLQFHPESFMTAAGTAIVENFLRL